ncbi:hypothetical protein F5B22DRAFT_618925 [Xylaria bambusicola]|uniref:uncharacterized protein n=1 Tax=Xylaria bambusicola TaxID=326684 RepID=UPI002008A72C|nr:uncharacterized protein F5B22DRAFT_618925 [Xylaria bambusicola]KAI0508839.1 hypothetical protein F5B22DRAFT_618925 [Xylaria bambusicola]
MDDFSDDDFDALNANALQELENNAIQFTQAQKPYPRQEPPPLPAPQPRQDDGYDYEDDDLDDAVVVVQDARQPKPALSPTRDRSAQLPTRIPLQQQQQQQQQRQQPHYHHPNQQQQQQQQQQRKETWRPNGPSHATGVGPRPSQQMSRSQNFPYSQIPRPPPPLPRPAPSIPSRYQPSQAPRPTGVSSHEIAALQAQILDLKSKLTTKDGEISIVRKRLEKSREDHERELQIIKAQTAEQLAKQERAVEAARAAKESATTELEFTRRDLREEVVRAKRHDGPGTPKKNSVAKAWGVSDGFEDVEMAGSPTKGKRGKNAGPVASSVFEPSSKLLKTPTKSKRKRPAVDSPVMALETHSDDVVMLDDVRVDEIGVVQMPPSMQGNLSFDYVRAILNHSAGFGRPLTLEYLSHFKLPSRPNESLASILLTKLSTAGDPNDPTQLPIQFCLEVIRIWDACKKEACLAPITSLVALVSFTLQLQTVALAPYIAPTLLPVAMEACYEVAIPRFNNSVPGDPTDEAFIKFRDSIDTTKILSLLYLTALGCATSEPVGGSILSPVVDFWNSVHIQFVLMLLHSKQPVGDFTATLRLLGTSVFPDSIGPINPDKEPEEVGRLLIDRISVHLTETPRWDIDEAQLREVRLAALQTLSAFARSSLGLIQLAKHQWMIPRLVTLLSCSIEELYDGDMQYSSADGDAAPCGLQRLVAHVMQLLHMVITAPLGSDTVDVSAKLAKTTGGSQKYLISLSRLNFADDLVSEDTAELAHELLEMAVTSEAGQELGEFFNG